MEELVEQRVKESGATLWKQLIAERGKYRDELKRIRDLLSAINGDSATLDVASWVAYLDALIGGN